MEIIDFLRNSPFMVILGTLVTLAAVASLLMKTMPKLPLIKKYYIERRNENITAHYYEQINTNEYILFQDRVLKNYYKNFWTKIFDINFPVYTFAGLQYRYPFNELYNSSELIPRTNINYSKNKYYNNYKRSLHGKIDRPDAINFMLNKLFLDDNQKIYHFDAWAGTYADNVYTSHILEYELYYLFKKYKYFDEDLYEKKIKKELIIRNSIHCDKEMLEILSTGCNRASSLGIQLLVIFKDHIDLEYKAVMIERSNRVAAKPNYYQFIPSGGFEAFDNPKYLNKNYKIKIKENYSIVDTIFKEFAEELFNEEDFLGNTVLGDGVHNIRKHPEVERIINMIDNGTALLEFLGSAISLIDLRNELSFVLLIDDDNYSKNRKCFEPNYESDKEVLRMPVKEIKDIFKTKKINPGSAGLWDLFQKSDIYKKLKEKSNVE